MQQTPVEAATLGINQPAPFVEVSYHVGYMNLEHFLALTRLSGVLVDDACSGPVHGAPPRVDTACDVDILGVHEIPLVEESAIPQRGISEEQEASEEVWAVEGIVVIMLREQVTLHTLTHHGFGEKAFCE